MNETSQTSVSDAATRAGAPHVNKPQIPSAKLWLIGGVFLLVGIGMYAGTMYRIQNYGYVGLGADQPIKPGVKLTD